MAKIKAVIGANYGDEGKGLMTDYFSSRAEGNCLVVCNNGGAQRGHTVVNKKYGRHVFNHFGSGLFSGADIYLSEFFIINPMIFVQEMNALKEENGFEIGTIYANPDCLVSTPYDMMMNNIVEECRGEDKLGSCGVGIWETIKRCKTVYKTSLKHISVENADSLKGIRDKYFKINLLSLDKNIVKKWEDIFFSEKLLEHYLEDVQTMLDKISIIDDSILNNYENIIIENGQGLLLDDQYDLIHGTPSNTGSDNIVKMLKNINNIEDIELCYVTRSYMTRHGAGDFPSECQKNEINRWIIDKTNVWNPHQEYLRYGHLDLDDLYKRIKNDAEKIKCDKKVFIAITHLDEYRIDTSHATYLSHGETIEDVIERR